MSDRQDFTATLVAIVCATAVLLAIVFAVHSYDETLNQRHAQCIAHNAVWSGHECDASYVKVLK